MRILILSCVLGCAPELAALPVDQVAPHRLTFTVDSIAVRIPYDRNLPVSGIHPQVDRAVVLVHGSERNSGTAYDNLSAAAAIAGVDDSTALLVAPQFLLEEDIAAHALPADVLYWSDSGWKQGNRSLSTPAHPRPVALSAFAIMDSILYRVATRNPNLRSIVVGGHSAGAQFVQRYAAGNVLDPVLASSFGIAVSYVVANPSSYLYLDDQRAVPGSIHEFETPSTAMVDSCPDFDTYKYGLAQPNTYMSRVPQELIRASYPERTVNYMLGLLDVDPNDPSLDTTCAAALQGAHRLARGITYGNYLSHIYGSDVQATHRVVLVPGVGHSSTGMFTSTCGAWLLFRGTYCGILSETDEREPASGHGSLTVSNPLRVPTTIRYRLARASGPVTLRIHDVAGRVVRTWIESSRPSGAGAIQWDGTSGAGRPVPAGIYFCSLQHGAGVVSRKTVVVR